MRLSKEQKNQVTELLEKAQSTVDNVGVWEGQYSWNKDYAGVTFWIGDKSGSRVNQYEAIVKLGLSFELRARTFPALVKKIVKVLEQIPSNNG